MLGIGGGNAVKEFINERLKVDGLPLNRMNRMEYMEHEQPLYVEEDMKYIQRTPEGNFKVMRTWGGRVEYYGTYDTLEEAQCVRDSVTRQGEKDDAEYYNLIIKASRSRILGQSSTERENETRRLFESIKPYLDEGYSFTEALIETGRIKNPHQFKIRNGWGRELREYAEEQGYDYKDYKLQYR